MKSQAVLFYLTILLSSSMVVAEQSSTAPEVYECIPGVELLKDAPENLRLVSTNSMDEPFYLSAQFCFILAGPPIPKPDGGYASRYDDESYKNMYISYQKVYRRLPNKTQRLN